MNYQVNIYDNERDELIKFHQSNIQRIDKEIDELQAQREHAISRITELVRTIIHSESAPPQSLLFDDGNYYPELTLARKAEIILIDEKRVLNTREIALHIKKLHHPFVVQQGYPDVDIKDLVSNLGATLKQKVDKGDTFHRIDVRGVWYYGIADWFRGDGTLYAEFSRRLIDGVDDEEMNGPLMLGKPSGLNEFDK